ARQRQKVERPDLGVGELPGGRERLCLLLCEEGLIQAPQRMPEYGEATGRGVLRRCQRADVDLLEVERTCEHCRQLLLPAHPALHFEVPASRELGDVKSESPVEKGMKTPVVVASEAVGARDIALDDVRPRLELRGDLVEDPREDLVQDLGATYERRVARP